MQIPAVDIRLPTLPATAAAPGEAAAAVPATSVRTTSAPLPQAVAAAILRATAAPDLGPMLGALVAEIAALPASVEPAAAGVREAVSRFLPADARPLDATRLQSLVEDGGLHYEAKAVRSEQSGGREPPEATDLRGLTPPAQEAVPPAHDAVDLKGGLLQLLRVAHNLGGVVQLPAARAALAGVEAQQAANVLAAIEGTPYVLQVPFPDGGRWRTLNLALEPERRGRGQSAGGGDGFRLLLHVPLSGLGEAWVDAGLGGGRLRAVVYLDDPAARERVRAELPGLRQALRADGFAEVLLDVRPAADLPGRRRALAAAMTAGRSGGDPVLDVEA